MRTGSTTTRSCVAAFVAVAWSAAPSPAASQPLAMSGSPDIHLDQAGTLVRPGDVSEDIEVLMPALVDLGPLPDGADVTAFAGVSGNALFALGHSATLLDGVVARPRDLIAWDGASYNVALDGAEFGIPDGVAIDAFAVHPLTGEAWLSFDTDFAFAGVYVRDADVVDLASLGLAFDSAAAGIPAGMDVDAVGRLGGTDDVLVSFDVGGTLGGVAFSDEDVLRYDAAANTWSLVVDASAADPGWVAADLDAAVPVPEPSGAWLLRSGLIGAALLAHRRTRLREKKDPRLLGS